MNLPSTEDVMRGIAARVPHGVRRLPDGETGDRRTWIGFQWQKLQQARGLEEAGTADVLPVGFDEIPQVRVASGIEPGDVVFPNLGYADSYRESYATFTGLRSEGVVPESARFQVQYPTPLASVASWFVPEDQDRIEPFYETALFADLDRLLQAIPHERLAVQWDVAVEFHLLDRAFKRPRYPTMESIVRRLARAVDQVPDDVPVGLHLCYGDNKHQHFKDPESLEPQVVVANGVGTSVIRPLDWIAFTVPQEQCSRDYFEPLRQLRAWTGTSLYFGIIPYHPTRDARAAVAGQVALIDEFLGHDPNGRRVEWGISTECGMGRVDRADVPDLLDLHGEILRTSGRLPVSP